MSLCLKISKIDFWIINEWLIHVDFMHLSREISRAAGKLVTGTYDETLENDAK